MLKGKQVDMMVNLPYAIAKGLPRSEAGQRGINPQKGSVWTQNMKASGKMQITFDAEFIVQEKLATVNAVPYNAGTPGGAQEYLSPDRLSWTFTLKPGLLFHDGTRLDAEAVKFSFDRLLNKEYAATRWNSCVPEYCSGPRRL